jgi:hypothetical protein
VSCKTHAKPEEEDPVVRAQKMREEATEKEVDGHFTTIRPVIPMKQEWRVKEKASAPALMASNDDMD